MKRILPGGEPFAFKGNAVGCLLIHGFTSTPAEVRPLGEYLADQGYTAFGPRLFGHATEVRDMNRARFGDWIVDVQSAYEMLRDQCSTVIPVGQSMGSVLALLAASQWETAGAVALAVPAALPEHPLLPFARLLSPVRPTFTKRRKRGSSWVDQSAAPDHLSYEAYPTRAVPELKSLIEFMLEQLPNIDVPVLVLQSELDQYAPPAHAERILAGLRPGLGTLKLFDQSGHILTRDAQHQQVFQAVAEFVLQQTG